MEEIMKIILSIIFIATIFSCDLNIQERGYGSPKPGSPRIKKIYINKYYDSEGNEITDPELLEKIKSL